MTTRSNSLQETDIAYQLHPYTNARVHEKQGPMIITKGDGCYVYDSEGKKYLEGLAGLWSVGVGFSQPRLVEAAAKQMAELPYYQNFAHKAHAPGILLSEKLVEITPEHLTKVFYTNSGSEANDTVVKFVWFMNNMLGRPEKKKFLSRNKAYHGITVASGSLTGLPGNQKGFDLPAIPVVHLTCPHYYRWAEDGETEAEFTARLLKEAEETILAEGPETIAAFIGEPVMGAGGVMTPPEGYWPGIEALCRKYDILIVSDEVINGFGRTGKPFGCERYGFKPDILVTSKQLTSSYMPLAAILMTDEVYQVIADYTEQLGTLGHGFTAGGNPVACAVALENIKIIEEQDLMGNVARLEDKFQSGLRKFSDHPMVGEVRGVGLIAGIELVADKATKKSYEPAGYIAATASKLAAEQGLIVRNIYETIGLCPPMIIDEAQIDELLEKLGAALEGLPT
ncbi:Taurine--pyruvate aminotransferase [Thalassovita gelatinovora]|uniref:Taurine--pyruvate aminotransferase n=1 Tax=Thalassovita gelatinovora TaxID=53501 RepID=A0A0P1FXT5_THAGE|nr:aspartate aminotransferase family protein [Thalassovita gelatinovora]QIZ80446.1 aspartate aminotransferase family protein [Thalassovita gelatinovora]CUH65853.1 Taurine--pyruvate aminotransferase [Thalassovita gelatinovora]SEQ72702.1 4-aminobutyrate---pyruvate transaminase [Thalassovita gelatinovora]